MPEEDGVTIRGMKPAWILVLCVALHLEARERPIILADVGKSTYTICISADASPSERRGAEELQRFLQGISGVRLPVATDQAQPPGNLVLVGRSKALDKLSPGIPFDTLGSEGFVLKTAGPHLVIAGDRTRGTMYGVYAFLEKLGCRWFAPYVSRIPKMRRVAVRPLNEVQRPSFEYREPFFTEAFDKDWAARNKTNGAFSELDESTGGKVQYYPFVHSFYTMIPPDRYFREHPEYFSLIDGKRRVERGQLCLTNSDLLRESVNAVLGWIAAHPEATIFSVSQNDWTGWCECDNCLRVEEEEGGAHSGPLLRFVNALAEEVEKRHPDKLIDTLAYWYTETPPLKVRPRRNVRIRLCPIGACEAHPYEHCDRNAYFIKNLRAWSQITNQLYIWHYNTNFAHYLLPFPDFDELAADIPMYRRYGVVGLFMEGAYPKGGGGENAELRSYVMARLMWDTNTNADRAIDEFIEGYYGRAASKMRAYFDLLHRQVRMPPAGLGHHLWIYQNPGAGYLDGDFLARARALFEQAEKSAESEAVRERIRKAKLPIKYVELSRARKFDITNDSYAPADLVALKSRFARFMSELRHFGITSIHEGRELTWDEEEFAGRIRPYAVITLENGSLRADLAPELSARIFRLVDRRSGRNLLREADPGERSYPDRGGLSVSIRPEFRGRDYSITWSVVAARSDSVTLAGKLENGLTIRRTVRLAENRPRLETETLLENKTNEAIPAAMQSLVEYSAGFPEDPRITLAFRRQDGSSSEQTLYSPGLETSGSETYMNDERPDGEWRVSHPRAQLQLINRFDAREAARCVVDWSVRGENRVGLAVWSEQKTLLPGGKLSLRADYEAGLR